jgi:predicted metalloprotease with PDZ domain
MASPFVILGLAAALQFGPASATPAAPQPHDVVAYRMSPVLEDGKLTALAVEVRYAADATGRGDFEWSPGWAGEKRLWQWARDLKVQGATKVEDAGEGHWRISAPPGRALTVTYRVVSAYDHDPTVGEDPGQAPPIIRPTWFYSVGESLFGAPAGRDAAPAAFAWTGGRSGFTFASDLQHLADAKPGAHGPAARPGTVADIQESIALGGTDVRISGSLDARSRVRIASRGVFKFSAQDFDALARRIIDTERAFWGDGPRDPFLVTIAPLQGTPNAQSYSGTGRTDAFAIWYDTNASLDQAKWLLAHEYFHTWDPRQLGGFRPESDGEALGYWFSEGFTDYYARRLTLGAGVWSLQDFADAWNEVLKSYGVSMKRNTPNRDIPQGFWSDPELKQLPYWRGALIAIVLDRDLRAGDAKGLDGLLRALRRHVATSSNPADSDASLRFREMLRTKHPDLDAWVERTAIAGETVTLPADSFAPCFTVATQEMPTFDRGFDLRGSMKNDRRVVGLEPNGPAARAGLKAGDRISVDESTIPDPTVARRYVVHDADGKSHVVTYLPQGPMVPVQQIAVAPGLDGRGTAACLRLYGARS